MKTILKYITVMTLFTTVIADELPTKTLSSRTDVTLTRLYDMTGDFQNDNARAGNISNAGSNWVREEDQLIGTAPTEEYNAKKREEREAKGANAHVKNMPIIGFAIPSTFRKNEEFGYVIHFLAKSEGEDHRKGYGIKGLTGGRHDATHFVFNEKGLSLSVHSKKREVKETLATNEMLKYERGKWYELYIESNRKIVMMKVRDTVTNETVILEGKHSELNRHNLRMNISGIHNLQTLRLADLDFSYYESF